MAYEAHGQWLLGDDWLFVPVVQEGVTSVTVMFPGQGALWRHVASERLYPGRTSATVAAPLGTPALFVRDGVDANLAAAVRALLRSASQP